MGPLSKRRKLTPKVEEVNFDPDARHEFLTGFRKRKQQRIKHAQDAAEKRAREERRQDRKKIREERAAEFKRVMEEHQKQLKRMKEENNDGSDSSSEDGNEDDQEWEGFEEPPAVDYEAEYIDEDKYTTVTVEEMDTSREGLRKSVYEDDSGEDDKDEQPNRTTLTESESKPKKKMRAVGVDKPKKKKKQFRYESKQDRKLAEVKQRISKAKKAKARRER